MPTTITNHSGGELYASALIGEYQTATVKVDVSALTDAQLTLGGYLKPNVVLTLEGTQVSSASPTAQIETATVTGTITATTGGGIARRLFRLPWLLATSTR